MRIFKIILTVIVLSYAQSILAQSGWISQNSGTNNHLNSVFFCCLNIGWVVGDSNTVLKTADAGDHWIEQNIGTSEDLHSIFFIDLNTGWIVGKGGTVKKTTNGGVNWLSLTGGVPSFDFYSVTFTDINTGYIVGSVRSRLKTTNGGDNWVAIVQTQPGSLYSVSFPPSGTSFTGYCVGGDTQSSIIYKTINAGLNWTLLPTITSNNLYGVYFTDIDNGWAVGDNGKILRTTNSGNNWIFQNSGTGSKLSSVDIKNLNTGFVVGDSGVILHTTNGGISWKTQLSGTTNNLTSVYFATTLWGFAVGNNGTILRTTTGGVTVIKKINSRVSANYSLKQNYPNPFNPETKISFSIPKKDFVNILIFDALGRRIASLVNQELSAGTYEIQWNAGSNPSGAYYYILETRDYIETRKMVLIR